MANRFDDRWGPGVVMKTTCPFIHCHAVVNVLRHAPSSDRLDLRVDTVEQHLMQGPNSWYQRTCPASHLLIPLSTKGEEVLYEHAQRFESALAQRLNALRDRQVADLSAENAEIEARKRAGMLGHIDRPAEEYYPPRPGDTEEAQAEFGAGPNTDPNIETIPLGGRHVTSSNSQTISMLFMAKRTLEAALEDASIASATINLADAKLRSVDEHLTTAVQLVAAAAMNGSTAPKLADEASGAIAGAGAMTDDASARLAGGVLKTTEAMTNARVAIGKIDQLIAQLSA